MLILKVDVAAAAVVVEAVAVVEGIVVPVVVVDDGLPLELKVFLPNLYILKSFDFAPKKLKSNF